MRRRAIQICLALLALTVLAVPAAASAKKRSKKPVITRVTPMRLPVGGKLTIRGKNFSSSRKRNTVIFRGPGKRTALVKPKRASRRKLVVVVPSSVGRALKGRRTARFKLRVLVKKHFSGWTRKRLSPVVVSSKVANEEEGGGGGLPPSTCLSGDADGDLLSGSLETQIGTDPCLPDTDGDGVEDGFEEQSAIDLNHYPSTPPLPYPGKRPYPNALDPSDANTDYDGDVMTLREEYLMWVRFSSDGVRRSGRPTTLSSLLYSDGLQRSRSVSAPAGGTLLNWALDQDGNGVLSDDERDADGDGLANWDESHGQMIETWWPAIHDGTGQPTESKYPDINFLDNADLPQKDAFANSDMDGDGVLDGADDNDHDGLSNQFEVRRPSDWLTDAFSGDPTTWNSDTPAFGVGPNPWAYTNPFNPCKPFNSDRCHTHPPIGYYSSDGVPPIGPNPPGGYPGTHPTTPNG